MYINKNRGVSLIEVVCSVVIFSILLQVLYTFFGVISRERDLYLKNFKRNLNRELIFLKIDENLKRESEFKVYTNKNILNIFNYEKKDEDRGEVLIFKVYSPEDGIDMYRAKLYMIENHNLIYKSGKFKDNIIIIDNSSEEILEKNIEGIFIKREYGVEFYGKNYKRALKK